MRTRGVRPCSHVRMFACSCRIPASPLEAVLNRRIIACSGTRTTAVFARKTSLYLFSAKSTDRSLRLASRSPRNAARKVRILACSGTRTTDSPRARSGRLHSLVLAAPAQRGPEVVPAKATCGWFWRYLLTPKGSYTPRQPPRFCLPDGQKAPTVPAVRTARRQAIRKKNLALRPACTIFGSALYRRRLGKLQTSLHLRPSCTIFVFIL